MGISYELAKELKEAGWPQPVLQGHAYTPSLSELIAACPPESDIGLFHLQYSGAGWIVSYEDLRGDGLGVHGATPEEVVAKLWLALTHES